PEAATPTPRRKPPPQARSFHVYDGSCHRFLEAQLALRPKGKQKDSRLLAVGTADHVLAAVEALGKIGPPAQPAVKTVIVVLKDIDGYLNPNTSVPTPAIRHRKAAAVALGRIGSHEALIELRASALADPDSDVRKAATEAVHVLRKPSGSDRPGTILGKVTLDGKPLGGGTVTFDPTKGGKPLSTAINPDGTFLLKSVPAGSYKVRVVGDEKGKPGKEEKPPKGAGRIPAKYNQESVLLFEVTGGENELHLALRSESGPLAVGRVSGRVTYKGKPLPGGAITFVSAGGLVAGALIDSDGRYQADRVPVGEARIAVNVRALKDLPGLVALPERYSDADRSGLTYTVTKGKQEFNIDLR
ncbi:MAG: HEAT repeat domain-containing protein, partial [Gemmataceae bacterium]|nr:HEAT repeat domain-containing protein [Gemmataceae bacterium]